MQAGERETSGIPSWLKGEFFSLAVKVLVRDSMREFQTITYMQTVEKAEALSLLIHLQFARPLHLYESGTGRTNVASRAHGAGSSGFTPNLHASQIWWRNP